MYTEVSEALKSIVKGNLITTKARLTFKNFFSDSSDLIIDKNISSEGIKLADYCFDSSEGKLIGTAASKELEVEIINKDNYDLADKEFDLELGVLIDRENKTYEYVPYGRYVVTSYEDLKSSNKYRIIANDIMCKLNPEFRQNKAFKPTYPITAKEYYRQLMESYGIEIEEQELTNGNFLINNAIDFEGNTGRYVLGRLAELFGSFAKINRNNKCQMYLKTETDEVIELSQMNSVLEIDNRYGPVNVVTIGLSQVEGENVTLEDVDSMAANGETTIRIDDNPFLYTEELREKAITPLFNRLKGFTYIPVSFKYKALLYSDCGDAVQVRNKANGELVDTIIFNQDIVIPATRQSKIESLALTNTEQKYKYISQTKQFNTRTEILVDKQNQKIESVVSQIGDRTNKTTSITQDLESIETKVNNVVGITNELYGINELVLNECMNGNLLEFRIIGNNTVFNRLITGQFKVGPNALVSTGKARIRVIGEELDISGEVINTTETIHDFGVVGVLRQLGDVYDEFVLQDNKAMVIRRIAVTSEGEMFVRETPEIQELGDWSIPLVRGRNRISIIGFTANMYAKWVIVNDYTSMFATTIELESAIKLAEKNIELSVTQKVTDNIADEYATKELLKSSIELSEKEITAEVNKKVNEDDIIASLNLAVENDRGIVSLKGNVVEIDSDKYKLTKDGEMIATAGKIANWNIEQDHLYAEGEGLFYPTIEDTYLAYSMVLEKVPTTDFLKTLYDVNNDGKLTLLDVIKMNLYATEGKIEFEKKIRGKVEIKTDDPVNAIVLTNTDTKIKTVKIGIDGIVTERISSKIIATDIIELGTGTMLMEIAGNKTRITPASSYTHEHLFQFDYDGEGVGGRPTIKVYVDTTFVGDFPAVLPNHKFINTPEANGSGVYILTSKQTYLEVQDGNNTYMIPYNTSDSKLKDNMKETDVKALEVINKIKHYSFDWKHNKEHVDIGYKADELYEQDEMLATRLKQQDESYLHQFNSNNILALCTKSIQELNKKIQKRDKIIEFLAERLNCKDEVLEMLKKGE